MGLNGKEVPKDGRYNQEGSAPVPTKRASLIEAPAAEPLRSAFYKNKRAIPVTYQSMAPLF